MAFKVVKITFKGALPVIGCSLDNESETDYKTRLETLAKNGSLKHIPFFNTLRDHVNGELEYSYEVVNTSANAGARDTAIETARSQPAMINSDTYVEDGGTVTPEPLKKNVLDTIDLMIERYSHM